jgi:hypothetical protein
MWPLSRVTADPAKWAGLLHAGVPGDVGFHAGNTGVGGGNVLDLGNCYKPKLKNWGANTSGRAGILPSAAIFVERFSSMHAAYQMRPRPASRRCAPGDTMTHPAWWSRWRC